LNYELQAYLREKYKAASFRVVPGHLPSFSNIAEVDEYFNCVEKILKAFEDKQPVTQFQLKMMAHAIGLDYHKPYIRHGKRFYKAYRNNYSTTDSGEDKRAWEALTADGYAANHAGYSGSYYLTVKGLAYVAGRYGIEKIVERD
jgi:3-hydroxy-3-methylglutaryl CoA synthase